MKKLKLESIFLLLTISLNSFGQIMTSPLPITEKFEKNTKNAYISVKIEDAEDSDSLMLLYWGNGFYPDLFSSINSTLSLTSKLNNEKEFKFCIPKIGELGYFSFFNRRDSHLMPIYLLNSYIIEPGDNIEISFKKKADYKSNLFSVASCNFDYIRRNKNYLITFQGIGDQKYKLRYYSDSTFQNQSIEQSELFNQPFIDSYGKYCHNNYDNLLKSLFNKIDSSFSLKNKNVSELIKADLLSQVKEHLLKSFGISLYSFNVGHGWNGSKITIDSINFYKNLEMSIEEITIKDSLSNSLSNKSKTESKEYSKYIIDYKKKLLYLNKISGNKNTDLYIEFKNKYTGKLRDKILCTYLYESNSTTEINSEKLLLLIKDASSIIEDPYFSNKLQQLNSLPGRASYPFELSDIKGTKTKQIDFLGKVVLIDFWYTGCGACSRFYIESLSKVEKELIKDTNVVFVTISIDGNTSKWEKSIKSGIYTSEQAINLYTNGKANSHPIIQYYNITGYPHTLIIDKNGKIYKSIYIGMTKEEITKTLKECLNCI